MGRPIVRNTLTQGVIYCGVVFEVHSKATGDYNKLPLPDGTNQSTAYYCIDSRHKKV